MRGWIIAVILIYFWAPGFGQEAKKVLDQFNVQAYASNSSGKQKQVIAPDEELTIFNLNDYKFTTEPNPNKSYKEYQVIKLDGMSSSDLIIGMITGTLERESRFVELSAQKQKALVREVLNENADYFYMNPFEREYFIAADGTFRYLDGRELVGSKRVRTYLEKGKPITATTFFFAMKDKGLINPEMSLRTFISLSTEDKVELLDMDIYATPKEVKNETAPSESH